MKAINSNDGSDGGTLSVFCVDSIGVKARVTFDSCITQGIQCTFWMDEEENFEEKINSMFDILFEEMLKTMKNEEESNDSIIN